MTTEEDVEMVGDGNEEAQQVMVELTSETGNVASITIYYIHIVQTTIYLFNI